MKFILGEQKEVGIKVYNRKKIDFEISNATYALNKFGQDKIESEGPALIDNVNKEVLAIISPQERGTYSLILSYEVSQEKMKAEIQVVVR